MRTWHGAGHADTFPPRATGWAALAAFFLLAYALTWACWLPLAAYAGDFARLPVPVETLATMGQFGPSAAAFAVAGVGGGRDGLRDFLQRLFRWRVSPLWFGVALLLPLALALTAIGLQAAWTGQGVEAGAAITPDVAAHFLYILLAGGPLGEEPGWRGFALPRLQAASPPVTATLVLALVWAGWHLPLWWVADVPCSFGFYVVGVVPLTYLFTWLSDRSAGSVPIALAFHASVNTCIARLPLFPAFGPWTGLLWLAAATAYYLDRATLFAPRPPKQV